MLHHPQELVHTLTQTHIHPGQRRQAETQLIRQYQAPVKATIDRYCQQWDVAQDVFQDTFKTVLEQLRHGKQLNAPDKLRQYLTSTAKNMLIAHYRKRRHDTLADDDHPDEAQFSPQQQLQSLELREKIIEAIGALTQERDRELLVRYFINEHDKAQICQDLDIAPERFDGILFRARSRFVKRWQEKN